MAKPAKMSREGAEAVAVAALAFVAGDPDLLPRFLAVTGIEASAIRRAAREPGFLAGVMGFVAAHEPTLLAFAAHAGVAPADVSAAAQLLEHGEAGSRS